MIMLYQCQFMSGNKCVTSVQILIVKEAELTWGQGVYGKFLYLPL